MCKATVLVLNPNSVDAVTRQIDQALDDFRFDQGPLIRCETLPTGPAIISTQADVDGLTPNILRRIDEIRAEASIDAVVVACFSDPSVYALRETLDIPIFGIAESAYLASIPLAERFGVISISGRGIARHARQIRALGLDHRFAADRALDLEPQAFSDPQQRYRRLLETGALLRDRYEAGVIILGCAGLSEARKPLQQALGIRVIDPVQAALAQALGNVLIDH